MITLEETENLESDLSKKIEIYSLRNDFLN